MDYSVHKQTYSELEKKYHKSVKTIRKYFDSLPPIVRLQAPDENRVLPTKPSVNLVMDTTYFGRNFGVMVFRGNTDKTEEKKAFKNLYWKYLKSETLKQYHQGIFMVTEKYRIRSFTVDNKSGLIKFLERRYDIPIQLCQYHMVAVVIRYITQRPKTRCGKDLKELILNLKSLNRKEFTKELNSFLQKHADFIQERNYKLEYIHQDIRSAITSIQNNLHYLFTYERFYHLNIPKTTNSAEGSFSQWKYKVKLHRGLSKERKRQMIDELLKGNFNGG